jgi:hypothetical protein
VRIHIWIRKREPVAGHATVGGRKPVPFEGWLDLLELLSDIVRSSPLGEQSSQSDIAPSDEGGRGRGDVPALSGGRCHDDPV